VKAQGDGWLTTVTLIEGENIAPSNSGIANPYVVFTCNGETRTSSVKLRTAQPHWGGMWLLHFLLLHVKFKFLFASTVPH
jgi:hypothetical protein